MRSNTGTKHGQCLLLLPIPEEVTRVDDYFVMMLLNLKHRKMLRLRDFDSFELIAAMRTNTVQDRFIPKWVRKALGMRMNMETGTDSLSWIVATKKVMQMFKTKEYGPIYRWVESTPREDVVKVPVQVQAKCRNSYLSFTHLGT